MKANVRKRLLRVGLGFTVALLCAVAPALAQGRAAMREERLSALFISPMGEPFRAVSSDVAPVGLWFTAGDANGDESLSQSEFLAQALDFFDNRLDANRDATATSYESNTLWSVEAPAMLSAPTDSVSAEEAAAMIAARRGGAARGRDGEIPDRARQAIERELEEMEERAPKPAAIRLGLLNDIEPVMSCDLDLSRRVTREEFEACARRRFDLLDANRDGGFELSESERAQDLLERWRRVARD